MAATRLRKTFHYPDSSDDEDTVEAGMDAQDQAHLLSSLRSHDTTSTRMYTLLLLAFPATIALFTLPGLLGASTLIPSFLALASLAASAYTLYVLPLAPTSPVIIVDGREVASGRGKAGVERKQVPWLSDEAQEVLAQYIVPANGAVCGLLAVAEVVQGRAWSEGMMVGGGYLPGLVLTVVLWARRELRVVDMSALQQLASRS
ncbi:uncharacterized protein EKO05_0007569 [Ascochyta rabiei]|uniref:Uncharacterized protein n=1 Tax=Didymella rabiei TaxID=5454 RepID=A0A163GXQ2_DIDRA|nr:uncharacterized protein EKO05_0007569 [Ascochyta rabiei]KZM25057.1 hypothetical protein ST47_g3805 [Ascochyta rabiei]UPX17200.1 hypothetical protein EKO05_0007569 [Ascochyta rabiei]